MLDLKVLLTRILTKLKDKETLLTPTITLANTTQESFVKTDVSTAIKLDDNGKYLVFLHEKIKTTTARAGGTGAFRMTIGDDKVKPLSPTNYTGYVGSTVTGFYPVLTGGEYWCTYSGTWNANTNIEVWGTGIFEKYE